MANEIFQNLDLKIRISQKEIEAYTKGNYQYLERIKAHYLNSLILLIVSEYEIIIEKLFYLRAAECKDAMLVNFVKNQMDKIFRSPDLSNITKTLKMFDEKLSESFVKKINNTTIHSAWDNLMKARHSIVHRQGNLNLTYEELISSYPKTKGVIFELVSILGVDLKKFKSV